MKDIRPNDPPIVVSDDMFCTMGIPPRYRDARLSFMDAHEPHTKAVLRFIDNLLENIKEGRGLLLIGSAFTGKTSAASIILRVARERFRIFPTGPRVMCMRNFWEIVRGGSMQQYYASGLLLLDDVGAEYTKAAGKAKIESLLSHRHDNKLSTIITTNLSPNDMTEQYGESLSKRFKAMYEMVVFEATP